MAPFIWCSIDFLYLYCHFFLKVGEIFFYDIVKICSGHLIWESLFSSVLIILRFGLFLVSWISWILWVRRLLCFEFSLTVVSISSTVYFTLDILYSIFCILLVILTSVILDLFPRFFISFSSFVFSLLFLLPLLGLE